MRDRLRSYFIHLPQFVLENKRGLSGFGVESPDDFLWRQDASVSVSWAERDPNWYSGGDESNDRAPVSNHHGAMIGGLSEFTETSWFGMALLSLVANGELFFAHINGLYSM